MKKNTRNFEKTSRTDNMAGAGVLDRLGLAPSRIEHALRTMSVCIRVYSDSLTAMEARRALRKTGLRLETNGDVEVVIADHPFVPVLEAINIQNRLEERSWMLVCLNGSHPWIGPVFQNHTSCFRCLLERLRETRMGEHFVTKNYRSHVDRIMEIDTLPAIVDLALNASAVETIRWLADIDSPRLASRIMSLDATSWRSEFHAVPAIPSCPVCSTASNRLAAVNMLDQAEPSETPGYRAGSAEQRWEQLHALISPVTGIVRRMNRLYPPAGEQCPFYVFSAQHSLASRIDSLPKLKANAHRTSTGKGRTVREAQTSALCEALERYSGLWRNDSLTVVASTKEIGREAMPLDVLQGYSETQRDQRDRLNDRTLSVTEYIPRALHPDEPIAWSPVWSISQRCVRWVPAAHLYYDYPCSDEPYGCADSNGNAAGGTMPEAVFHGLLELIERDAVAIWWYNRIPRPAVDLDTIDIEYVHTLRDFYRTHHREIWVLDITNDLALPGFVALSRRIDRLPEDIIFGAASHSDPHRALLGALNELNQLFSNVAADTPAGTDYRLGDPAALNWLKTARIDDHPYLSPLEPLVPFPVIEERASHTGVLERDLFAMIETLTGKGFAVLIHDQTRSEIGLAVVKTIVPGFNHWWRRLGNERLYRVPVEMGWRDERLTEDALNPYSIVW